MNVNDVCLTRANISKLGIFNTQRPHTGGIKTILNNETSKIEQDLCASRQGEVLQLYVIALV